MRGIGTTRPHKGSRALPRAPAGSAAKPPRIKLSIRRREILIGKQGASSASSTAPPFLVERSKDIRTPVETEAVLHWAHSIVTKYPYQPPTADLDVLDGHCAPGALAISLPLAASQAPIQEQLTLQRQQVQLLTEIRDCVKAFTVGCGAVPTHSSRTRIGVGAPSTVIPVPPQEPMNLHSSSTPPSLQKTRPSKAR